MFGVTTSDDYRPVTWMGRYPVDVTTILVGLHVIAAILTALIAGFFNPLVVEFCKFDSTLVLRGGYVWQMFTYAFVHPPSQLIWFAVHLYFFYFFGREVERYLGRRSFIILYSVLLLAPPVLFCIWGLNERVQYYDSLALDFAVYATFAMIYPNMQIFFGIVVKWFAIILGAILTLQFIAANMWPGLAALWLSIGVAFLFLQIRGAGPELQWMNKVKAMVRPKPRLHVVQKSTARRVVEPDDVYASVDPILEKISKSGIGSLTEGERRQLDRARKRLLKESQ